MKRIIIDIAMTSCIALNISLVHADSQDRREQGSMMNKSITTTGIKSDTPGVTRTSDIGTPTPGIGTGAPDIGTSTPAIGSGVPDIGTSTPGIGTGVPDIDSATPGIGTGIRGTSSGGGITSGSSEGGSARSAGSGH